MILCLSVCLSFCCVFVDFIDQVDVDINSDAAEKYDISAMPTFKFIKEGKVLATIQGANDKELEAKFAQLK